MFSGVQLVLCAVCLGEEFGQVSVDNRLYCTRIKWSWCVQDAQAVLSVSQELFCLGVLLPRGFA